MTDKDFTLATLFDDFFKIAKVNLYTGEFSFVKAVDEEFDAEFFGAHTIDEYTHAIVAHNLIHADDVNEYLYHISLSYLQDKILHRQRRLVHTFRRRWGETYIWLTVEVTVPKAFSKEQPWVIFTWKEADSETCVMEDSIRMLSSIFHKILKINLTEDTHEEIKIYPDETTREAGFHSQLSVWLKSFADCGYVYRADLAEYHYFTDIEYLRKQFRQHRDVIRCRYRRRTGDEFRWVSMELLPSVEYTDANQVIMLYIRDIHDDYITQLQHQKKLEYYCNYDNLTGLLNRHSYNEFCNSYNTGKARYPMAAVFADVNGLKYMNDNYGHENGDTYIKEAAELLVSYFGKAGCYRISGDEFVILLEHISREEFEKQFHKFYQHLHERDIPIISIGSAWMERTNSISTLIRSAETAMYADKQEYYISHPHFKR